MPKNWCGSRCVSRAVAKNTPITGRVVAIPSNTEMARIIHSRYCAASPRRKSSHARASENRKMLSKNKMAATSVVPPTGRATSGNAVKPTTAPRIKSTQVSRRCARGFCLTCLENHHGNSTTKNSAGTIWSRVSVERAANAASRSPICGVGGGALGSRSTAMRRSAAAAPMKQSPYSAIHLKTEDLSEAVSAGLIRNLFTFSFTQSKVKYKKKSMPKKSPKNKVEECARPYTLGKRKEASDEARKRCVEAANAL